MKKLLITLLLVAFCVSLFIPVNVSYANSGPMRRQTKNKYLELLPIDDDDISVKSEVLTFDFTKEQKNAFYNSPISQTTAVYDMRNANNDKQVTMGFPLITTIEAFKEWQAKITLDDSEVSFTPHYASAPKDIENLTFEQALSGINQIEKADIEQVGVLHKINLRDVKDATFVEVNITFNKNSKVIFDASGMSIRQNSQNTDIYHLSLEHRTTNISIFDKDNIYFYVIGDNAIDINVNKLDSGRKKIGAYNVSEVMKITSVKLKDFILSLREDMSLSEVDYAAVKLLEDKDSIILSEQDLLNLIFGTECLILLSYTVMLKGNNQPNILSVSYALDGGYSAYYKPTLYTYNYISSPAKSWASFGSITINILTNKDNPYVIDANLDFTKVSDLEYQYIGTGIPKENIRFSVCASENPVYDKWAGSIFNVRKLIKVAVIGVVILIVAIFAIKGTIILVKKQKEKDKDENNT
ncbi:MAG: hypothetical protein GX242_01650 [Clostridiales bacterium]|nr:hypothetical protein [Clostridiales bacterium]